MSDQAKFTGEAEGEEQGEEEEIDDSGFDDPEGYEDNITDEG